MKGTKTLKPSKKELVLSHLKEKGSITSLEAFRLYGATRLSGIIFNLRKSHIIDGTNEECIDNCGNRAFYTRYLYVAPKEELDGTG